MVVELVVATEFVLRDLAIFTVLLVIYMIRMVVNVVLVNLDLFVLLLNVFLNALMVRFT
jgi:hypothetical protein